MEKGNKKESKKVLVIQSNALTEGRQDYNLIEKRIMYGILIKCREKFIENQNEGQKDLFGDLIINLSVSDLLKSETNLDRLYEATIKMRAKDFKINNENVFLVTGFINYAKHDKGSSVIEIGVSKHIIPHVVELVSHYTAFELIVAMTLKSIYSQRFYEICNQWKNTGFAVYSIAKLRFMFSCEEKYKSFGEFQRTILDVAQKELKANYDDGICDVYFTWKISKRIGKRVDEIEMRIIHKNSILVPTATPDDLHYFIKTQLTQYFPTNKGFVNTVLKRCQEDFELAEQIQRKITKICEKYSVKERPAVMKYVLEMDFEIS